MTLTRRQMMALAGAGIALPQVAASQSRVLPAFIPTAVIDAAFDMTRRTGMMEMLAARKVRTVFRYYAYKDQPERNLPHKVLRKHEAEALWDAGINIGAVFQYNNDKLESITPERGKADAEHALDYAQSVIGQPAGSAIYFGVDGSWHGAAQLAGVMAYFEAVRAAFQRGGNRYRVGAYGSGLVLGRLLDAGLVDLSWLALSRGWPGTRQFYNSERWNLFQFSHHLWFGKNQVDGNVINPVASDFGDFGRNSVATPQDFGTAFLLKDQFYFSNRRKAAVYKKPDSGSAVVQTLTLAFNPIILKSLKNWHAVSLDGTDRIAGYVKAEVLTASSQMPEYR
nr:glycoside hydrolase domain-containing protein [Amylibacter sp.]